MKRLLFALLFAAFPALAQTTFTCNVPATAFVCTPTAASCAPPQPSSVTQACPPGQTGTITTTFACAGSTWTPVTTNNCVTSTPPPGVQIVPSPPVGGSPPIFTAQPGVLYAWVVPILHGSVSLSRAPESPNFSMKVSLSKVAGDMVTAAGMPLQKTGGFGGGTTTVYPYYALQGDESGGLVWTNADLGQGVAVVAAGWYFSFQSQASVPVSFYMQIPQQ